MLQAQNQQFIDEIRELKHLIASKESKSTHQTNNTTNTIIAANSGNINTGVVNNSNVVVQFGRESITALTPEEKVCILQANVPFIECLRKMNFNENLPEHHNVYMSNIRSGTATVYRDDRLMKWPIEKVVEYIFDNRLCDIQDIFRELKHKLDPARVERMENRFARWADEEGLASNKKYKKEVEREIRYMIYNYRDMVMQTHMALEKGVDVKWRGIPRRILAR